MRVAMIALLVPLLLAANSPEAATLPKRPAARMVCPPMGLTPARNGSLTDMDKVPARKLGDLPPASQQYAVIRTLDGCAEPTVIRDNIGGR